jgi:hypothetical protein
MTNAFAPSRRGLLKWGAASAGIMVAGSLLPNFGITAALATDLGEGDVGVLNYAYALEQLEAAFYSAVVDNPYEGATENEIAILADIRDHEIAHRQFLKKALGRKAIPSLEVDFSKVDFSSRKSVLGTADVFENLGVAAYNGAGPLIQNVDYLAAAGSIVSVEARHAATIAVMTRGFNSKAVGAGSVDRKGLDDAKAPAEVLAAAGPFITTPFTANSLT